LNTPVRILRGRHAGSEGWIAGTLADRAARLITKALVHIDGEEPELLATSSLLPVAQLTLDLQMQKDPPQARKARGGRISGYLAICQ
jgi:hypothetical protein